MYRIGLGVLTVCVLGIASPVCTADEIDRAGSEALMAECQRQRAEKIAPLKQQAIEECVEQNIKDRDGCERYYENYGQRTHGGSQPGMFWDLPVCEEAVAAEKYFRMYPGQDKFTPD